MKRAFLVAVLVCAVVSAPAASVEAFRCGSRLISFGIGSSDVSEACGAPSWVDSWEESRLIWIYMPLPMVVGCIGTRLKCATVARIKIEEWIYNNGPTQFVSVLRFENGRLVDIEMGDYGY